MPRDCSDWQDAAELHSALTSCDDAALKARASPASLGRVRSVLGACRSRCGLVRRGDDVFERVGVGIPSSLRVLEDAFRVFGGDAVYASFNGGKDACVVLHLLRAASHAHALKSGGRDTPKLVYFDTSNDFDEVRRFVTDSCDRVTAAREFDVAPMAADVGFVAGLEELVNHAKPRPLAFVLGTRTGDPNCGDQKAFEPSSDWMPPFMRVNPILDWSYGDVWAFLRTFNLPYCTLYDDGYTSLGSVESTRKNPALLGDAGNYKPAHQLDDWALERAGRVEKPPKK